MLWFQAQQVTCNVELAKTCAHENQCPLRALGSITCIQTTRAHVPDLCCSVNVDGFTTPRPSNAIHRDRTSKSRLQKHIVVDIFQFITRKSLHSYQQSLRVARKRANVREIWSHFRDKSVGKCWIINCCLTRAAGKKGFKSCLNKVILIT